MLDSTTSATLALKDRRADTFMFDDALLLGIAANDSQLKLTTQKFLNLPWGIGIRQGDDGHEAVGRRRDPPHDQERRVRHDPEEERSTALLEGVPDQRASRRRASGSSYPTVSDPAALCP